MKLETKGTQLGQGLPEYIIVFVIITILVIIAVYLLNIPVDHAVDTAINEIQTLQQV